MPIIKSAKKRVRVAKKNTARNVKTKRSLKEAIKAFQATLTGKKDAAKLDKAQSAIDTAVKKGLMHKNKAARKKKQLAAAAKSAGVKPTAKKAKKTATKKSPAKKAAPKKTATKKTAAKKTTARKTTTKKK